MTFSRSKELSRRAHAIIPGGAHTYAKGDDQFPEQSPGFIARGEGCRVWDVDGNEFIEYGSGLRAITLGHGYKPVCEAAYRAMLDGTNFSRPAKIEVAAAERFLSLIDGAEMVKFGKHGSDATNAAVKVSRAHTGRDMIAICGDHPFFSVDDWFIGSTAINTGIPQTIQQLTVKFRYNDPASLQALFDQYPNRIACTILEAENSDPPSSGFLKQVLDTSHRNGAVMILDEIITGFRFHLGGAQNYHGVTPDLSTFGKAMGNGFAVSALAGKREIMELGGLETTRDRVFMLSLTHGAETHGLAAHLAVIDAYEKLDVVGQLWKQGTRLQTGVNAIIDRLKIRDYFHLTGRPVNLIYVTKDRAGNRSQEFRTLFLQEMIKRGVLCPNLFVNIAHFDSAIDQTLDAISGALGVYRDALEHGVERFLEGRPVKPVARRRN